MTIHIDRDSPVPAFIQIEQDLRRQIMSGQLPQGARLARETLLAERYGASRVTVRRALQELAKAQLVQRIHGVGTIATPPEGQIACDLDVLVSFADQLTQAGHKPSVEVDRQLIVTELPAEFDDWREGFPGPYVFVRRLIRVSSRPLVLNSSWLPQATFPGLEDMPLESGSLWKTLNRNFGTRPSRSKNRIEVIRASSDEARLLLCEDDAPLPRLQGAVFDSRNRLVELCSALWSSKVRLNFSSR